MNNNTIIIVNTIPFTIQFHNNEIQFKYVNCKAKLSMVKRMRFQRKSHLPSFSFTCIQTNELKRVLKYPHLPKFRKTKFCRLVDTGVDWVSVGSTSYTFAPYLQSVMSHLSAHKRDRTADDNYCDALQLFHDIH